MKKLLCLALTVVMLLACTSALAAGKLEIAGQNVFVLEAYSDTIKAYAYALVENTGDRTIYFDSGLLELYDAEGETVATDTYPSCLPRVLQPGEKGYLYTDYVSIDDGVTPADVDDYMFDVTGKGKGSYVVTRYPATVEIKTVEDSYSKDVLMYVTVQNNTQETIFDMNVAAAVLDGNGIPVFVEDSTLYNIGIPAGMSAVVELEVSDALVEFFDTNGFAPTVVDCIAYTEEYDY